MRRSVEGYESREEAIAHRSLWFWDQSWGKNLAASFLAFLWLGVGDRPIVPVGLLIALGLMLPAVPGWSLWRRLEFAGRRTFTLMALSIAAFLFAHLQIGVLAGDGSVVYARPTFLLPSRIWSGEASALVARQQACSSGVAESCLRLGRDYLDGAGVASDPSIALRYFEIACEGGSGLGCVNLGRMFSRGIGVGEDRARAKKLYLQACHLGELVGCHNHGALQLAEGHHSSGMDALMRACSKDFGRSCFLVGEHIRDGSSRQRKDPARARMWLDKACRLEVKEACEQTLALTERRD